MKEKGNTVLITIIVIAALVFGIYYFTSSPKETNDAMEGESMMEKDDAMMTDDASMIEKNEGDSMMMEVKGSYEDYAPEKLAQEGKKVLFFKASWCPSCNSLDKDIMANINAIPGGVSILKVDYDKEKDLKKKYGITYQHTFVQVDENGNEVAKWSGSSTLTDLLGNIQ